MADTSVWTAPAEEGYCVPEAQLKQAFALFGSHYNVVDFKSKCKHVHLYFWKSNKLLYIETLCGPWTR